ncbi:hypothetical protein [Alkalibacillus aidingensis]|uniref:hypothetical protein n=1 Tax=Alkalibacillus aidingensis TaxID=2747607 RepID=UPI0016605F80|nr:hypothetical protein [Alkalibacillus aidingensis]
MDKKRGFLIVTLVIIAIFMCLVIYLLVKEWDMIQMKLGNDNPIMWEEESGEYVDDEILLVEIENKNFEELGVNITDLFYLPNLEQIHFGLWYDSSDYSKALPKQIFHVELIDENGHVMDHNYYSNGPNGLFGQFQRRQINNVSLVESEEVYMVIYPVERINGEVINLIPERKLVFTADMQPLNEYK